MVSKGGFVNTDRYAVLCSEHSHPLDVVFCDVGGDDQDGGVGVTQLIAAVHLTEGPALIREALKKTPNHMRETITRVLHVI